MPTNSDTIVDNRQNSTIPVPDFGNSDQNLPNQCDSANHYADDIPSPPSFNQVEPSLEEIKSEIAIYIGIFIFSLTIPGLSGQ